LRREKFDLMVDFQMCGRSRIQAAIIAADRRIGLDKGHWMANFVYTDIVNFDYSVHAAKRIANTLQPLGVEAGPDDLRAEMILDECYRTEARRLLDERGIPRPYVILQTTTGHRPEYRHWPAERFARVADHLSRMGYAVVLTSMSTSKTLRAVVGSANLPIYNLTGTTDPLVLAGLLEGASLYVGYNTGPMHLAASVGTPIVALFDVPSDEVQWHPLASAPYRIVKAKTVPQPPGWRMDTVGADEVISAIGQVLSQADSINGELMVGALSREAVEVPEPVFIRRAVGPMGFEPMTKRL
jgi:ADP-heptose:LPS heptosyltransferase